MVSHPTVLILGAGASKPYGLPTGEELVSYIRNDNDGELHKYFSNLDNLQFKHIKLQQQFNILKNELKRHPPSAISLDNFLETQNFEIIGKLAIAYTIYKKEKLDSLFDDKDWYAELWKSINADSAEQFLAQKIKIYTFNYDLSLDYYLYRAAKIRFNIDLYRTNVIRPIHIYGYRGKITKRSITEDNFANYEGYENVFKDRDNYLSFANDSLDNVHLINDPKTLGIFKEINESVLEYNRVVFMGFGYDPANTKNFDIVNWNKAGVQIIGTAFEKQGIAFKQLTKMFFKRPPENSNINGVPEFVNLNCLNFLLSHTEL